MTKRDVLAGTILVHLDPVEVHTCEVLAALRHARHLTRPNGQGLGGSFDGRDQDASGLIGEYAVAKAINRFVPFVVEDPWETVEFDVGRLYQVRSTLHRGGGLLVQKKDDDDHVFILARLWELGDKGMDVRVGGWIWGRDAKKPGWWQKDLRSAAYLVSAPSLYPMEMLPPD